MVLLTVELLIILGGINDGTSLVGLHLTGGRSGSNTSGRNSDYVSSVGSNKWKPHTVPQ